MTDKSSNQSNIDIEKSELLIINILTSSFIFTAIVGFISFSVAFGQINVVDSSLIGIFDSRSISSNFYSVLNSMMTFIIYTIWSIPFILDIKNQKSSYSDMFFKFNQGGWKLIFSHIFLPVFWMSTSTDKYDLLSRLYTLLTLAIFGFLRSVHKKDGVNGLMKLITNNITLYVSNINLIFLALTNYGSHITYSKLAKFNKDEGITLDIGGISTKAAIIFSSSENILIFDGKKFLVIGEKFPNFRKNFDVKNLDDRTYLDRGINYVKSLI